MATLCLRLILFGFVALRLIAATGHTVPSGDDFDFELLTENKIASLPEAEQSVWRDYLKKSIELANKERQILAEECKVANQPASTPAPSSSREFELSSKTERKWYTSAEAKALSDVIISFQTPSGGWSKSVDYTRGPRSKAMHWTSQNGKGWHYCGTLDNRTTTEQIKFLASVASASGDNNATAAALKGLEWIFVSQYPNGGWPQNYPLESGYHEAITLNDNAFVHVLELLQLVRESKPPFEFADDPTRKKAADAYQKGIDCIAAMQVEINGHRAVWCAQHDPITLAPTEARKKEPASLSGGESAELLKYLMRNGPTDARTISMIESGLKWLEAHRITGLRKTKNAAGKTDYVEDPGSTEVYWARFYDLTTGKPIFAGADDGVIYSTFSEMASKNKVGYDYFTTRPAEVLSKEVSRWRKRH